MFYIWGGKIVYNLIICTANEHGQLGFWSYREEILVSTNDTQKHQVVAPKTCSFNILVKQVACGSNHTHLLSRDGFLYSMGSNEEGKLGLGVTFKDLAMTVSPRLVESIK